MGGGEDWFDGRILLHDLAIKLDLFLLLFFWMVARRWSAILGESLLLVIGVILMVWLALTLLAHRIAYSLSLTF